MARTRNNKALSPGEIFAENLRGLMAMKNVSAGEMQEYMGISPATYYKRLKRPYEFTVSNIESAAKKLGVSASAMLAGVMEVTTAG
jgi:predicted transcriptional regulator